MLILSSPVARFIIIFYSVSLLIMLYYTKKQIQLLLEYNSTKWHFDFHQNVSSPLKFSSASQSY